MEPIAEKRNSFDESDPIGSAQNIKEEDDGTNSTSGKGTAAQGENQDSEPVILPRVQDALPKSAEDSQ